MKAWGLSLTALVLVLLLAACGPEPLVSMGLQGDLADSAVPEKAIEEVQPVILTMDNNGEAITLQVGQEVHVFLTGNPTTGYMWASSGIDSAVLHLADEPEYAAADDEALGSGGEFDFFFTAAAPGETVLTLIYHRSFEKDAPPKRTFSVKVVVTE